MARPCHCRSAMPSPFPQPAASLTPELAFVVQLQSPRPQASGELAGRVEHIASGRSLRFVSLAELSAFMAAAREHPRPAESRPMSGFAAEARLKETST
ncbi:hypothetical protein [Nevskia ramosa]|uniref:hypothetical protein n=1 Tax=Nevskia ramosa TaxID=64002 RepID=UPI003D0D7D4C